MQQAQKAAAKAEAQRLRSFRLESKRRIVEAQFFQGFAQRLILMRTRSDKGR